MSQIGTIKYVDGDGVTQKIPVWEENDVHHQAIKVKTPSGIGALRYCENSSADLPGLYIHRDTYGTGYAPTGIGSMLGEIALGVGQSNNFYWLSPLDVSTRGSGAFDSSSTGGDIIAMKEGPVIEKMPVWISLRNNLGNDEYFLRAMWLQEYNFDYMDQPWELALNSNWDIVDDTLATRRGVDHCLISGRDSGGTYTVWQIDNIITMLSPDSPTSILTGYDTSHGLTMDYDGNYFYTWAYRTSDSSELVIKSDMSGNIQWSESLEDYYGADICEQKIDVDPTDSYLAVARNFSSGHTNEIEVRVYDTSGNYETTLQCGVEYQGTYYGWVSWVQFSHDGNYLYTADEYALKQWNTSDWSLNNTYEDGNEKSGADITTFGLSNASVFGEDYVYVYAGSDASGSYIRKLRASDFNKEAIDSYYSGDDDTWNKGIVIPH